MAETLESLEVQRLALTSAIRSGALSVRHGDKAVQYRSLDEMRATLADVERDIEELNGVRRKRKFYVGATRGY